MKVILAEKPSVARDLARFLGAKSKKDGYYEGSGYQVTWAYGHLVTLKEPHDYDPALKRWRLGPLPFIPERFGLKVLNTKIARKQYRIVKSLFRGASELICATDAGREGELIFRYIQQLSGCTRKPFKRLWLSSLTPKAIRAAFANIADGHAYDNLFAAARCRSEADWAVGINATRSFTLQYPVGRTLWSVGRVQTPVLALIVTRDDEIRNFKPEPFWELRTRYRDVVFKHTGGRFTAPAKAQALLERITDAPFTITGITAKDQRQPPPLLFDLTELQRHMNRSAGLSAAATLEIAQKLYERKLLTYPRTDSRYLSSDMRPELPRILSELSDLKPDAVAALNLDRLQCGRRIINNQKVSDHHAIIPTGKTPGGLTGTTAKVFDAVVTRFIAAFYPYCEKLNTTVDGQSNEVAFRARGTRVVKPGWMALYPRLLKSVQKTATQKPGSSGQKQTEDEQQDLPAFRQGETGPHEPLVKQGETTPPKHFTESMLLSAMETCGRYVDDEELREALKEKGIGTPATRAQVIETLLHRKYIVRRKKTLLATDTGRYLISLINTDSLKSPELTGEWEGKLKQVEAGALSPETFMTEIADYARDVVSNKASSTIDPERLGPCPLCGKEVIQGKRAYGCSGWRDGCTFVLVPNYKNAELGKGHVRELLQTGTIGSPMPVIDDGGLRQVRIHLTATGELADIPIPAPPRGTVRRNSGARRRGRRNAAARTTTKNVGNTTDTTAAKTEFGTCPLCGSPVTETAKAFGCSAWKTGCKFAVWKRIAGKRISAATAKGLIKNGKTSALKGFKSKAGKPFQARLTLVEGKVKLDFD